MAKKKPEKKMKDSPLTRMARLLGKARMAKLSPAQLKRHQKKAIKARWDKVRKERLDKDSSGG